MLHNFLWSLGIVVFVAVTIFTLWWPCFLNVPCNAKYLFIYASVLVVYLTVLGTIIDLLLVLLLTFY